MYEYTDKVISYLNKRYIKLFRPLKSQLAFDELNVISSVNSVYSNVYSETCERYKALARRTYRVWYKKYGNIDELTEYDIDDTIDAIVLGVVDKYNPLTTYIFKNEFDRRRARAIESIIGSKANPKEVETAMKSIARMNKQYADIITDKSQQKALLDAGIKYVKWQTEKDDKVCSDCVPLNNKVFDIMHIPEKPHLNCRCYVIPAERK